MNDIDFKTAAERLAPTGYPMIPEKVRIRIPDARRHLLAGLNFFTEGKAAWLPCYDEIAAWLTDNHGRGLLLTGGYGLGKTVIGMRILPILLNTFCRKIVSVYTAQQLNTSIDDALGKHIVYVDDIGTEGISNSYGNRRIPFTELCDMAEMNGKLLMVSTNMPMQKLTERYGERAMDRLRGLTMPVVFKGKSLRRAD